MLQLQTKLFYLWLKTINNEILLRHSLKIPFKLITLNFPYRVFFYDKLIKSHICLFLQMISRRILKKIFWKNTIISYFDFHYLYNQLLNVKQWKTRKIISPSISVFIYLSIYLLSIYLLLFVYLFIFLFISCLFFLRYLLHLLQWDVFLSICLRNEKSLKATIC